MGNVFSPSEVDAVLSALEITAVSAEPSSSEQPETKTQVVLYDFEHPQPLRPAQVDALRLASATACRSVQVGLMRLLRTPVAVNFLAVEQSTFRDYLATSEAPTCLAAFRSTVSAGLWLVELGRSLAFTFIDCLLGGQPSASSPVFARDFTDVETRLISKAVSTILRDLSGELLQTDSLKLLQVVSDGALMADAASNEAVALLSFELVCGPCQGLIQLCVPWKDVSKSSVLSQIAGGATGERMRIAAAMVPVIVTARLARLKVSARDLANLSPGDLLVTDTDATAEISLEVDHREIFRGTPAQSHNRKVFLVSKAVSGRPNGMMKGGQ